LAEIKRFLKWCKILRSKQYSKWYIFLPGPEWFWHALSNTPKYNFDGTYRKNTPGGA
tara:strand:- start:1461 stop:1631 length:171 start_codon:yes stop_codon:yes gene_type:complete